MSKLVKLYVELSANEEVMVRMLDATISVTVVATSVGAL